MRLTTKCSVALHCLIFIQQYSATNKVTSDLLAASTGCNPAVIRRILNMLRRSEIIYIKKCVGGSYLNCEPDKLTLWEIHCALEPDKLQSLIGMHPHPSQDCPVGKNIYSVLQEPYQKIYKEIEAEMKKVTLQTFLDCYAKQLKENNP